VGATLFLFGFRYGRAVPRLTGGRARCDNLDVTSLPASPVPWRSRIVGSGEEAPDQLLANPGNWRVHPKSQQQALAGMLGQVGWVQQVLVNRRTGHVVDGHLRVALAIRQSAPSVPVLYVDLEPEEEALVLATLDPLAAMAGVDDEKLRALLADVSVESEALAAMLVGLAPSAPRSGLVDPDEVPEPPDDPVTQRGDLWLLGEHRLLCGDAGRPADLDRLLDGAVVSLLATDPPYNVKVEPRSNNAIAAGMAASYDESYQEALEDSKRRRTVKALDARGLHHSGFDVARGKSGIRHHQKLDLERHPEKAQATHRKLRAKDRPLVNDFISADEFERLLLVWFSNASRVLRPGASFYVWGGYANLANYPAPLREAGLYFSQAIIWDKEHPVLTRKDFMGAHELAFYGWKEGAAHRFFGPPNVPDLWHVKKVNPASMVHLTEKPVELSRLAIEYSSLPGEAVLDLFAGSGSTLIAAEQTGRRCFGMELDPLYCDVVVTRFERFTGTKAERVPATSAAAA
jgi:DNA modification methylase